jgi:lysophospholipid hydrolase
VILTRLQRVTFLTAHKYLGLTREVIRTEKAINELACHPLPAIFWESGGIHRLRQRFVPATKLSNEDEPLNSTPKNAYGGGSGMDYFALNPPTPYGPPMGAPFFSRTSAIDDDLVSEAVRVKLKPARSREGTGGANPGDLLTMAQGDNKSSTSVNFDLDSPKKNQFSLGGNHDNSRRRSSSGAIDMDFDLREAIMDSISKAIGLAQPTTTPAQSVEASPMVRPTDQNLKKAMFNSSFGSLSFLGLQGYDDESSHDGSSRTSFTTTELDNEVEILYFPQDSMLVKAGEKNAGLYFVIEGFLDVSMPVESLDSNAQKKNSKGSDIATPTPPPLASIHTNSRPVLPSLRMPSNAFSAPLRTPSRSIPGRAAPDYMTPPPIPPPRHRGDLPPLFSTAPQSPQKTTPLFTVKPGGIAGYLSSLSGVPSYVDIQAKTECYVGFLPAKALERIMDRKPIVLLTLAKRLISLLSPLVLHIDSALEWMQVSAGQVIYRQGDPSDSFYIVSSRTRR